MGLSWRNLLLFALTGLKKLEPQKGEKQSLTSIVQANLTRPHITEQPVGRKNNAKKETTDATLKKIVKGKLNDADISGALRVLSSEDTVAVPSAEVLDILRSKHPGEAEDAAFPDPPDPSKVPDDVTVDKIMAAIQSFPNGSAGGIDCLRPQHLKDTLAGAADSTTVSLARWLFLDNDKNERRVLLKIDFRNAFNTIHRDILLALVQQTLPSYFAFFWQSYRFPSKLIYGQHILD